MDVITTHINADFDAVGSMVAAKKLYPDAILVYPEALHNFKNTGESPLRFLCFVPNKR